ncbi:MAG: 50S ribosomal protein L4 [Candidatus Cloacimonetes bacterium]|nr:50S ribosomal protein L4 [Candidatus Cloacimonadota bacterium]
MLQAKKFSATGEEIGKVELPEAVFGVERETGDLIIHEVVKKYMANQRQGTASIKTRSEKNGSTRKLYRQKGTGSARVGNRRTVIRVGGGRAFGPKPKDWSSTIPKKKKRLALKLALSHRAKEGKVSVIEKLDFDKPNTKKAIDLMSKISSERGNKLLIISDSNHDIIKSFSNIGDVSMDRADGLYAYEILKCKELFLTEEALKKVEEVFGK